MKLLLALALAAAGDVNEIRIPEGFVKAEASPTRTATKTSTSTGSSTSSPAPAEPSKPRDPAADACRDERSAYLKRLLHMAGVEVDDPISFLEGLAGPGGYQGALLTTPLGVLPGVDPVRPLAWDQELRSRARDLAACARAAVASAGR
jgi:hypothetical protein